MDNEIKFTLRHSYIEGPTIVAHRMLSPTTEANLVMALVERWGCVAAEPDGEDSAGRQRIRLQTPQELVDRAVQVAALACQAMTERGWIVSIPQEIQDKFAAAETEQAEQRAADNARHGERARSKIAP